MTGTQGAEDTEAEGARTPAARTRTHRTRKASWKHIGPGIVVAATGVGAGDLVATLIAGSKFGYTLLWAAVAGCLVKISLAEATGRWHLATGRTILDGWRSLGAWTSVYFGFYVVVWGFIYGATAMSSTALPLAALFPETPGGLKTFAIAAGLIGLALVWFNRYARFEKLMTVLIGIKFLIVVYVAVRVVPDLPAVFAGLVPVLPNGSFFYTLGLIGGVGGTITMAAYGYWINSKGWTDASWMKMMRLDNRVAYLTTGVFVVAMLIIGAELLHASHLALEGGGDKGLLGLSDILEARFGVFTAKLFLIGFCATSFSALVGVWHGVSLLFADFSERLLRSSRGIEENAVEEVAEGRRERSLPFRAYMLWLTFPPMGLLWLDEPFGLVVAYGVLGALFMPFLALTLLWLLNSGRTPREWRNGWLSNSMLAVAGLLFVVLCVQQVRELLW
ncbi:Nramp family divalent metal transporter [Streptomyces sp. SCSIO 30461]|uniref:Nramp family divalent metal transporter n=1 Tax=Streptomyces sp. SCSIO 30461 TaxID=3118085 RepID=UPI0030D58018